MNALEKAQAALETIIIDAIKVRMDIQRQKRWRSYAAACVRSLYQVSKFLDFM